MSITSDLNYVISSGSSTNTSKDLKYFHQNLSYRRNGNEDEIKPGTLEKRYGRIVKTKIDAYYQYKFVLRIITDKYILNVNVGEETDNIKKYKPFGDWDEHYCVGINSIDVVREV